MYVAADRLDRWFFTLSSRPSCPIFGSEISEQLLEVVHQWLYIEHLVLMVKTLKKMFFFLKICLSDLGLDFILLCLNSLCLLSPDARGLLKWPCYSQEAQHIE